MKRSEMIKAIKAELDGSIIDWNYAEQFLNVVETLGMLPPKRLLGIKDWDKNIHKTYSEWVQSPGEVNKWEPETDDDSDNYCGAI